MRALLHAGIDRLAMWVEDRKRHDAQPYAPCPPLPLDCFGPVGSLPRPPRAPERWSAPSPRPVRAGDRMAIHAVASRAPFRGTVVLVPPWKIEAASLLSGYTDLLARAGFDVWLLVPPEHMERAAPGTPSGHGFASLDLVRFRALFEQLVTEIRVALTMAASRGSVGLVALSLGALAASIALPAAEEVAFATLIAPPADLASVVCDTPIGRRYRRLAERAGSKWPDRDAIRSALAPFAPGGRSRPSCRTLIAVGRHDRIALPAGAVALARAWRVEPRVYARGHLTLLFCCRALRDDLGRFLSLDGAPARRWAR